jgi:nitroimidazol reductase NimA-like FMN-containing flavoprotein (pyridoxamine 5'-phosphate oxidase superfamily)
MTPQHLHPRRKDRSKDEAWIRNLLRRGGAAVLATVRDGRPVPIPLNYVYDEGRNAVYVHTALKGATLGNLPGPAALAVFEMGRMLPADEALEFGVEYRSVVVFGTGCVVEDPEEAKEALVLIMEKYAPHLKAGVDYRPVAPEEIRRTAVLRVDIEGWSGKEKEEAPDFPGAYRFEDVRRD